MTDRRQRDTVHAPAPRRSARSPHGPAGAALVAHYVLILGVGLCAVLYLVLSWRAVELDAQVGLLEEELGRARFEHLQARRELFAALSPEALGEGQPRLAPTGVGITEPEVIPMPPLPPAEPCILSEIGGPGDMGITPRHDVVRAGEGEGEGALAAR